MIISSESEMLAFGAALASELKAGDWVAIDGPLGAGKTVLCKGILRGLGYLEEVSSPSYAIVHQYDVATAATQVVHADLYRINDPEEIEELGLFDASKDCITLVEWARNGGSGFGNPTRTITITPMEDGSRQISMAKNNG
jgi:tRNA threonylcarbamoyladenosine biosynthesis protein TsaE